jgi:hypothetical protein
MNNSARANVVLATIGVHPMTLSIPQDNKEMIALGMVTDWIPTTGTVLCVEPVDMMISDN